MTGSTPEERYLQGVAPAEWHWLRPHHQRDALWVVAPHLDLEGVARTVAADDAAAVQRWLGDGGLTRPTAEQLDRWEADPTRRLAMVIVQPFVFVQEGEGD